ncbi:MAG: hypothetical protein U0136_05490 [Bdellovibrionota bacterium]
MDRRVSDGGSADGKVQQLRIPLEARSPFSAAYFVTHSGVSGALNALDHALVTTSEGSSEFFPFLLIAPAGFGKTHLLSLLGERANELGLSSERYQYFDDPLGAPAAEEDAVARSFIAAYERMKSSGGVLVFAARERPTNPHIDSRLAFAVPLALELPKEEEMRPLVESLLERKNLRFGEANISYLLQRLPADPLSLSHIFAKIDELCLAEGRHAGRAVLREVLDQTRSR